MKNCGLGRFCTDGLVYKIDMKQNEMKMFNMRT